GAGSGCLLRPSSGSCRMTRRGCAALSVSVTSSGLSRRTSVPDCNAGELAAIGQSSTKQRNDDIPAVRLRQPQPGNTDSGEQSFTERKRYGQNLQATDGRSAAGDS